MITADNLLDGDVLLPGDVVVDKANHKPMQVVGYDLRNAEQVPAVRDSTVNEHRYEVDEESLMVETIDLPRGQRYFVPEDVKVYPEERLDPVLTRPATGERRPQAKVFRSMMAHLLGDLYVRGHEKMADGLLALMRDHFSEDYVDEIAELADEMTNRLEADEE